MWRKLVPTILLLVVLGAAGFAWTRIGSEEECERWASIALKKARISYAALRGHVGSFEPYLEEIFERKSFMIDGNLYRNPGGCNEGLLPANPQARP